MRAFFRFKTKQFTKEIVKKRYEHFRSGSCVLISLMVLLFKTCSNYLLSSLPINKPGYNSLICGTYFGLFQCVEAKKDSVSKL